MAKQMDKTYPAVKAFLDWHIIRKMAEGDSSFGVFETCWGLSCFTDEWITRDMACALLRDLTDRGFCYFSRGLFNDDGEVAGSGYGLTPKGLEYYGKLCHGHIIACGA